MQHGIHARITRPFRRRPQLGEAHAEPGAGAAQQGKRYRRRIRGQVRKRERRDRGIHTLSGGLLAQHGGLGESAADGPLETLERPDRDGRGGCGRGQEAEGDAEQHKERGQDAGNGHGRSSACGIRSPPALRLQVKSG